ncbi:MULTISPECIES: thermonuclease family protein [Gordonibacter]|uniref:Thermonuclease family protein n=1 Tax=Gordonibacter faecis TaxID=3047475 RepID=A0ABT7DM16_9ACTN|nr:MULTISPECIES: thermonuclease family protein [unclassified Gordonibacter]MDJ1649205.1 thermonuclease family protein [Gordonibacter sp. KGMB12511]HIW76159.1 thermonuclease family protein [Candidatus Gordonibacter avicola]
MGNNATKPPTIDEQQIRKTSAALMQLGRKNPLVALLIALVLVAVVGVSWLGSLQQEATESNQAPTQVDASQLAVADEVGLEQAEVIRVVDGDTLKVRTSSGETTVRLIGMDTPESVAQEEWRNCEEGVIASNYTKSLVASGSTVWLSRDVSDTDRYGRLLRYVWLKQPTDLRNENEIANNMLNAILVREGYAQAKYYRPDTTLHDLFERWGNEAAAAGKGVSYKWA